jgi:putative methionine-R-sulfoxide reductase with GAF domain
MKAPENIHGRLRLTYMGLAIVPLLVVGIVLTWTTYAAQRTQVLDLQQELAQRVGTEVEAVIQALEDNLTVTAQVTGLDSLAQAQQEDVLEQLLAEQKAFTELALLDENGMELARNNYKDIILREEYRDRSNEEEFRAFKVESNVAVYYSPVHFTPDTNEPVMTIAIPLIDKSTRTLTNVFMADVRLKNISDLIASIEVEGGDNVYIVQESKVIAHRNPSIVLADTSYSPLDEKGSGTGLDGVSALMGIDRRQFGDQTFTVVAETPASSVLELAFNSWIIILSLVAITIGAASIIGIIAANNLTRPIQSLVSVAENIREGDLSQQATVSGLKELDTLANTFNSMTAQLRQTLEGLEQRVADRTQALKTSAEVSRYLSTILEVEGLVTEVASLVQSTFNYYHVNIYLYDETAQNLVLAAGTGEAGQAMLAEQHQLSSHQGLVGRAATTNQPVLVANVNLNPDWKANHWLPDTRAELVVPIARGVQVLGVLDIQHNVVNGLKQEDADLMQSIANQLAVALLNAQSFEKLVAEKLAEAQQKEEAEKRLEVYRRSPVGQAEIFARQLLDQPENSLAALHELAQSAGQDSEAAALLSHLPRLLEGTQPNRLARDIKDAAMLAKLAEGVNFLFTSQNAPELLLVGLRTLTNQLEQPSTDMDGLPHAQIVYQACLSAVEANAISQITQLDWKRIMEKDVPADFPLTVLVQTLAEFQNAIDALTAYERVNTLQDKLAYLVSAVERLRHIERRARNQLGSADVSIILRIVENWQAIIARALSELQTQARLNCRLLTRHTWHIESISLTLNVRNEGRGAAINIRISLLPGPEYTLIDETAELKQLNPGEEEQVVLRVCPRMDKQITQFRARFVIVYDDPRGPNQSEHFADVIQLLSEQKQFQHIPNPYIVGTPFLWP